jgi:hypothetical protein
MKSDSIDSMPGPDVNRRGFLKTAVGAGAVLAVSDPARAVVSSKMIGIQVGAISFVDEGTEKVLDVLQERAFVNTLFLAVFTYGRGIAGRQIPGQPLPDHGKPRGCLPTTFTTRQNVHSRAWPVPTH